MRRFELDPQMLIGDAVREHEPKLSDAVYGGIFFPQEQHVDPDALMRGLHRRLVELGVRIVEHAPLAGVRIDQDRITEITAGEERLTADAYVLAAGPWTGPISKLMGVPLPVRPGKGYSIDTPPYGLRSSTNLSDAKVAVTPLSRNLRLAGTMEFGGLDEELNQIRIGAILAAPARYFRDWTPPATASVTPRAGIRPMTPDGLAIIGRLGRADQRLRLHRPRHAGHHPRTRLGAGAQHPRPARRAPRRPAPLLPCAVHPSRRTPHSRRDPRPRPRKRTLVPRKQVALARHPRRRHHPVHRRRLRGRRGRPHCAGRVADRFWHPRPGALRDDGRVPRR